MSSEKVKRYGIGIELDGYGRLCDITLNESETGKVCKYSDVEALEEERDGYKSAWENMKDQHEKNLSQLSQITEERDRAVELLEMAGPLWWVECELPLSAKEWEEQVEVFFSSLTKEKEC